jgi:prolyl-tRNA editing enzyme YbaK/EbsC (Cys-tRNA(Pro) deacylase)
MTAPDPSDRVQQALDRLLPGTLVRHFSQSTATALEAAETVGCPVGAIVKSLLFLVDGRPVLVLVAGDRQVSDTKLSARFNSGRKRVRMGDAATVLALTGYGVGGVPPIGHITVLDALMDASLQRFEMLYAAAGTARTVFAVTPGDLRRITDAEVDDVTR